MYEAKLKMFGINPATKIEAKINDPRNSILDKYLGVRCWRNSKARADHLLIQHGVVFYPYQEEVSDKILEALIQNLRLTSSASEEEIKTSLLRYLLSFHVKAVRLQQLFTQ